MKTIVLIFAILLIVHALICIGNYILDFNQLAIYGKGYLAGKLLLLMLGGGTFVGVIRTNLAKSLSD